MIMISKFPFSFNNFCLVTCFLTKLLILRILFSAAVNAAIFVAKSLMLKFINASDILLSMLFDLLLANCWPFSFCL